MVNRLKAIARRFDRDDNAGAPSFGSGCLPEEVDELSSLFKVQLPQDYREHLLACRRVFAPDIRSGYFLFSPLTIVGTWSQSDMPKRITVDGDQFSGELPVIPVGGDASGNLFLMSVSEDLFGSVWKWNHGIQPRRDGTVTHGVVQMADSFAEFLGRIADDWDRHLDGDSEWSYL